MRTIIIVCLAIAAAAAAEHETFTLKDGRTLVGVYDENAQTITLDGKGHAVMSLRADQIKEREVAPVAADGAAVKAKSAETAQSNQAAADEHPVRAPSVVESWAETNRELERLRAAEREAEAKTVLAWAEHAQLRPVPVPKVGPDPRASEQASVDRANRANDFVNMIDTFRLRGDWVQIMQTMQAIGIATNAPARVYDEVSGRTAGSR